MAMLSTTSVRVFGAIGVVLLAGLATLAAQGARGAPSRAAQQDLRVSWVNSQAIIQQLPAYAAAESTLELEKKAYRDELQRLQAQYDSASRAYDQQEVVLSPSRRQEKVQELRQMEQRLQQRYNELQGKVQARERELVGPLEERVKGVIEGLRAERNLAFIFDVGAPGNNIVAADRTLDLTTLVVQRLKGTQ